jgi:hypothetical protein
MTPRKLQQHIGSSAKKMVSTQCYDFDWWKSSDYPDPRTIIWKKFHFPDIITCHIKDICKLISDDRMNIDHDLYNQLLLGRYFHTYMDSFTHQGFLPYCSDKNKNNLKGRPWKEFWKKVPPSIGHAEFGNEPDEIDMVWYNQLGDVVDNKKRWIQIVQTAREHLMKFFPDCIDLIVGYYDKGSRVKAMKEYSGIGESWKWSDKKIMVMQNIVKREFFG